MIPQMTMLEVAQRAGVSPATVSRVVNGSSSVSSEAVESVRRVMREVGYKPKRRRSAIQANAGPAIDSSVMVASQHHSRAVTQSGVIALLMPDRSMDSHPTLVLEKMRGAEQAVAREGLSLVIGFVGPTDQIPPVVQREELI